MADDERDAGVKRAEDRYDVVRAAWREDPTPRNARRVDLARAAIWDARRSAKEARDD